MASTRRSSVLASFIDFLFISVKDSSRAFLWRLNMYWYQSNIRRKNDRLEIIMMEQQYLKRKPSRAIKIYILHRIQEVHIHKQQKGLTRPVRGSFEKLDCLQPSTCNTWDYINLIFFHFLKHNYVLAEFVLLGLPWHLLVLVLKDSSVVRHRSISEGA